MAFINQTKNSSSFSNNSKHPSVTFGEMPGTLLSKIKQSDVVLNDGTTFKDIKLSTPVEAKLKDDYIKTTYINQEKHED
jgi:hypothetical protein